MDNFNSQDCMINVFMTTRSQNNTAMNIGTESFQEEQHRNMLNLRATSDAARLAGMNPSTLDGWVRTGVISPTIEADGTGTRRMWTAKDITRAAIVHQLREEGVSLQAIRESDVVAHLTDAMITLERITVLVYCNEEFALFTADSEMGGPEMMKGNLHVIRVFQRYLKILSAMEKEKKEAIETSEPSTAE
jgi:DNA-binding transcriptional MerR regulator